MAKAYIAGKRTVKLMNNTVVIKNVVGPASAFDIYLYLQGKYLSNEYVQFISVKKLAGNKLSIKVICDADGTLYYALVKKVNPNVGKPIVKMGGVAVMSQTNSGVGKLLGMYSGNRCLINLGADYKTKATVGASSVLLDVVNMLSQPVNIAVPYIIMANAQFGLRDIPLL